MIQITDMLHKRALNHKIWYLAWPMIIANISVPLVGLVDTAILGHLENAVYLASVAVGSSVLSFLYWGFGFLRMGTTGLAAQAYGAREHDQSRLIIVQSMLLGAGLGLLIVLFSPLLLKLGLHWIAPPKGAYEYALSYSSIRIFSAPAVLVNYGIIGWLIGRQNTRWPLLITLFCNGLNLILDCALIIGLGMKSEGAALATLIAEYSGCAMGIWVIRKQLMGTPGHLERSRLWHWPEYRELIMVNRHLFVRTLILLGSFAFFTAQGAQQGDIVLAANTLIMQLLLLTSFGLDGFAHAAESLVGDAAGQRNRALFFDTCRQCALWSVATALIYTICFLLLGESLLGLLTSIDQVKNQAALYLPWLIFLPMLAVWSYLLDGIFIGTTQTQAMQTTMLFSALFVYLPCWYFTRSWGNHGLWFAFVAFNLARGVSLGWYFYRFQHPWRWWRN
jgi:MATE family, multidrug efflux pump